jgi:hypothetical protein
MSANGDKIRIHATKKPLIIEGLFCLVGFSKPLPLIFCDEWE